MQVYLAKLNGSIPVALKQLRAEHNSDVRRFDFLREVALLKTLTCSNIVQFQGAGARDGHVFLVTEYLDGGDLCRAIARKAITWQQRYAPIHWLVQPVLQNRMPWKPQFCIEGVA